MKKWQKAIGILTVIFLVSLGYLGYEVYQFVNVIQGNPHDDSGWDTIENDNVPAPKEVNKRINVLLLGIDARTPNEPSRTDTIIILSMEKGTKEAVFLSIPRDTRVNIPGRGMDKINHAHAFGGVNLTIKTVEEFLDIPVHYYARLNFEGFKDVVDTLQGVTIDVEPHVASGMPELKGKAGMNKLDGEQALAYVRFRKDREGDIGRVKRQQKFLHSIARESAKLSNVFRLPFLLDKLGENMRTNIPVYESINLGRLMIQTELDQASTAMIPGSGQYINRISYWVPDLEKTEEMVKEMGLREGEVSSAASN